ncbi:hypothetical protein PMI22_01242 [Pseudomonas sp. GM21]|nr:hypothetical protein PMI22_01242 [Pseudomonas sp. GM21]
MSLNLNLNSLLLVVTIFVTLHGLIPPAPPAPNPVVALPLMICPR